jgi:hypothetical protein
MLRYYPSFSVIKNLNTAGSEFTLNGLQYSGKYYQTIDGEFYSGPDPETGPSQRLIPIKDYNRSVALSKIPAENTNLIQQFVSKTNTAYLGLSRIPGKPNSYQPFPTEEDYTRGYITRYFTKKENEKGYIIEISREEYNDIVNGDTDYDIRLYQVTTILWKLTGPLNNTRQSQYNIIPGIIETNRRLTEASNKNFLGIVEFIGGDYIKFARPTI